MPTTWSAFEHLAVVTSVNVPHSPRSVSEVRRRLRAGLSEQGLDAGTVDDAEIVMAELLGNAVRHARSLPDGTVAVSWALRAGVVDVTVTDGGSPMIVARRTAPPMAAGGRGLQIVSALARAWGVVDVGRGRQVWATLVPAGIWVRKAS